MNKRIFQTVLLLMLALFGSTSLLRADEVTIGDGGTNTNKYLPTYCYYNYSLTQQLYTADEIGGPGSIKSIAFYCSGSITRNLDFYMVNTDKESFASTTDWITVTSADLVYSGSVTTTAEDWTTINLDTPFEYDGTANLALIVDDNTGSYVSSPNYYVFDAASMAIRVYSDGTNYDPTAPSYSGTVLNVKNQIVIDIEYAGLGNRYTISTVSNPEGVGDLTGAGRYFEGAECTLNATCAQEHYFINWTLDDEVVSTEPEYTFTVTGDATYVANFGTYPVYEITVSSANAEYGNVAGGGSFFENMTCVVRAAGKADYLFTNWTKDGVVVSTDPVYSFTVTEDAALVANFQAFDNMLLYDGPYTDDWFPIFGEGMMNYYFQSQYVMPDYDLTEMVGKSIKGMRLYLANDVDEDWFDAPMTVYLAEYATETISQFIDPATATTVFDGLINISQNELTIVFDTPYDYYGGNLLIGINNTELGSWGISTWFYMVDKRDASVFGFDTNANTLVPDQKNKLPKTSFFFDGQTGPTYEITASVDPADAGTVTGVGAYPEGQTCTLTAVREPGYSFSKWTLDDVVVSTNPSYSFTVTGNAHYVAHFEEGGLAVVEFTVHDGTTTNGYVPVYGFYADAFLKSEMVYPADELNDLVDGDLQGLKFYATQANVSWGAATFQVFVTEIDETSLNAYVGTGNATVVYEGELSIVNNEMNVQFTTPYHYNGGNLLVGFYSLTQGSYVSSTWYGESVSGASVQGYNYNGLESVGVNQRNFLPKTTFYVEKFDLPYKLMAAPDPMAMGYRPVGAWMKPFEVTFTNGGRFITINDLYTDNDFFQPLVDVPFVLNHEQAISFVVETNPVEEGEQTGHMLVSYGEGKTAAYEMSATAYVPVDGDVWENALEVTIPYVGTAPAGIHYNYDIPGGNATYNDAVYQVTVDQLSVLDVTTGSVPSAVALYTEEGFEGVGGPDLDNTYQYGVQTISNGDTFTEGFEDGIPADWTVINANWDAYTWTALSDVPSVWSYYSGQTLEWYRTGTNCVVSGSYLNGVGAISPDDYLVTPLITIGEGSVFSFWAAAMDAAYAADHFGVAISFDGNNFIMLDEWTMTAKGGSNGPKGEEFRGSRAMGSWYQYFVDLSEYAGQSVYIAIRHFDSYDQYILSVDDVELSLPGAKRDAALSGFAVDPGTYYVVVAAAEEEFPVNIGLGDIPAPVAAEMVYPADEATGIQGPCVLRWNLGDYTQEMQVLYGTQYPPTDVLIDWTDELVASAAIPEFANNTLYFVQVNERNYTGTTEGAITSFTSYLDVPELYTDNWFIYEGEEVLLYWDSLAVEGLLSFNVYLNDSLIGNTTGNEYAVAGLAYNLSYPYIFQITAVYDLGESEKSGYVYYYVSGNGMVEGHVYEQDGITPIADATVTFEGESLFGEYEEFVLTTDAEGVFGGMIHLGYYFPYAWKEGYQTTWFPDYQVSVLYGDTAANINILMPEEYAPVAEVTAEEVGANAEVEWTLNDRSLQYFRLYRGVSNLDSYEMIADSVFGNAYTDEQWADISMGAYVYGVSAVYQGNHVNNRDENDIVDFEEGLPEGWATIDADGDSYGWRLGSEAIGATGYGRDGSLDMMVSQSYDNSVGVLYPDNYLVTPQVTLGYTFTFWACAQDASYGAEHFSVEITTGDQTDASGFTTIQEWTISAKGGGQPTNFTRSGNRDQSQWMQYAVDLSDYSGQLGYIAIRHFNCNDQFFLDIDDVEYPGLSGGALPPLPTPGAHESEIVWSNIISKDMNIGNGGVSLTVTLNSGDSPEGTWVHFYNTNDFEQFTFPIEDLYLDETGTYTWEDFRKGTYVIVLDKDGYEMLIVDSVAIYEPTQLAYELVEETRLPWGLTVSSTAWGRWDDPVFPMATSMTSFTEDFENGIPGDWTIIDANDNGYTWTSISQASNDWGITGYTSWAHTGYDAAISASWINGFGAVNADEYLITPQVYLFNGSTLNFWAAAADVNYAADHFGVFVSTTGMDPDDFVEVQSWTLEAKGAKGDERGSGNAKMATWRYFSVDLSEYAGNYAYIAFRHFDSYDWYIMSIDDVELTMNGSRHYVNYNVILTDLEGNEIANFDTEEQQMQLPVDDLVEGETYICKVANVYSSGTTDYLETQFVYVPCDNYEGFEYVKVAQTDDGNLLQWAYTEAASLNATLWGTLIFRDGELLGLNYDNYFYDLGETEMHDYSFRVVYYDYAMSCEQQAVETSRWNVTAVADPEEYGQVTGSGIFFEGTECTVAAFANDNCAFVNWTVDDVVVSWNPEYSFLVEGETEIVAHFMDMNNHWGVDPTQFEHSMTITGVILIDGEEQESNIWEIGAFAEDDCHGVARLTYNPYADRYLVFMTVYGKSDEELTFKLFDHYTEEVAELMNLNTMNFEADAVLGTPFDPYQFEFFHFVETEYELTSGWNWWSTNIEMTDVDGMAMLQEGLGENATQISGQSAFTNYYAGYGWYGSLTTINNESMYRLNLNEAIEFTMTGREADPEQHPITLVKGWNHIGYVESTVMSVNDALANITSAQGDMVKTQKSYANYYEGYGWYGSLNTIKPGDGLMYKSTADGSTTFTYPVVPSGAKGELAENLTGDNNHWVPDVHAYPYNMTMMAVVELDDVELTSGDYELAAFANGECRGSIRLIHAEPIDRYVAFLTVSGEEAANLTFGLYNVTTGEECFSATGLTFEADAMVGNPAAPYVVSFRGNTGLNALNNAVSIYPNPVATGEKVQVLMTNGNAQPVRIEIVDAIGKLVTVESSTTMPASINVPKTAGVYTVRIITENNGVLIQKLVVK